MKQQGYTLIEFIAASLLSILLMVGLVKVYLSVQATFQLSKAIQLMQNNGRFASYWLMRRIQKAGTVCQSKQKLLTKQSAIQIRNNKYGDELTLKECVRYKNSKQVKAIKIYIAKASYKTANHKTVLALFDKVGDSRRQELIAPIQTIHFTYQYPQSTGIAVQMQLLAHYNGRIITWPWDFYAGLLEYVK